MAKPKEATEVERLKWSAEDLVRRSLEDTPAFKKAVKQTMKELKQVQKSARKQLRK